jgi:hypothetical protein
MDSCRCAFQVPNKGCTASLGSTVALLAVRRCRRPATSPVDRYWPLVTAVDRCLGHVGGTAGEGQRSSEAAAMAAARRRRGPSSVTTCLVGKPPEAARQWSGGIRSRFRRASAIEVMGMQGRLPALWSYPPRPLVPAGITEVTSAVRTQRGPANLVLIWTGG